MKMHTHYANALSARLQEMKAKGYSSGSIQLDSKPHDFTFSSFFESSHFQGFYMGGLPHVLELFEIFRTAFPHKWDSLAKGMNCGNDVQIYHAAHNLKPLFRMIGIDRFNKHLNTLTSKDCDVAEEKLAAFHSIESRLPQIMYMTTIEIARMKNFIKATA